MSAFSVAHTSLCPVPTICGLGLRRCRVESHPGAPLAQETVQDWSRACVCHFLSRASPRPLCTASKSRQVCVASCGFPTSLFVPVAGTARLLWHGSAHICHLAAGRPGGAFAEPEVGGPDLAVGPVVSSPKLRKAGSLVPCRPPGPRSTPGPAFEGLFQWAAGAFLDACVISRRVWYL